MSEKTISAQYLNEQKILHKNQNYGVASLSFAPIIADLIRMQKIKSVSDYGAGKKNLLIGLTNAGIKGVDYFPYDPVFPEYGSTVKAELVCCIDVLEHIEPELIKNVLLDLNGITENLGFFSVHMGPAAKVLTDGRNAHLIQRPTSWWLPLLCEYFEILHLQSHNMMGKGFWVIVKKKELPTKI